MATYVHEQYRRGRVVREERRFPEGPFASIVGATDEVVCALGRDGAVTCFGPATRFTNWVGPPDARFRQIAANVDGSTFCGVTAPAGEAACWGVDSSAPFGTLRDAPPGPYTRVEVADFQACGVRPDGAVTCWGRNACDASGLGAGPVEQLALSNAAACVRRAGEPVRCCGGEAVLADMPVDAELLDLTAGARYFCGVRTNGALVCWGDRAHRDANHISPPAEGRFRAVRDAGGHGLCALDEHGRPRCSGGRTGVPEQPFVELALSSDFACGRTAEGGVRCFGRSDLDRALPAAAKSLSVGEGRVCALLEDGRLTCWGPLGEPDTLPGPFEAGFAMSGRSACGLGADGRVTCFARDAPTADALRIVRADPWLRFMCGLTDAGAVRCWGSGIEALANPLEGPFDDLVVERRFVCGLRADRRRLQCWGSPE